MVRSPGRFRSGRCGGRRFLRENLVHGAADSLAVLLAVSCAAKITIPQRAKCTDFFAAV